MKKIIVISSTKHISIQDGDTHTTQFKVAREIIWLLSYWFRNSQSTGLSAPGLEDYAVGELGVKKPDSKKFKNTALNINSRPCKIHFQATRVQGIPAA
jgi:hypothetical protein